MCTGNPLIVLEAAGQPIGSITVHHARSIWFTQWSCHARLVDPEALLRWFDARGIAGPREEWDEHRAIDAAFEARRALWVAAMPASLRELEAEQDPSHPDVDALSAAWEREIPEQGARIRALLAWFGWGEKWNWHYVHESIPPALLLQFHTDTIVAAIESAPLSERESEGAARFFCASEFRKERPGDAQRLPLALRRRLFEHVLRGGDQSKIDCASSELGLP
jgi:hypothetical protein